MAKISKENEIIYLIEDDVSLRAALELMLSDAGFKVHAFGSAELFLGIDLPVSPAVILVDMTLPGLSGLEMYENLRDRGVETPLIFMSGNSNPHQIIGAMKLGVVDFVWKPFEFIDLLAVIRRSIFKDHQRITHAQRELDIRKIWNLLSEREKQVCKLILLGYGNTEVASWLGIQPDTANKHRIKVFNKLRVSARPELIKKLKDFKIAHEELPPKG